MKFWTFLLTRDVFSSCRVRATKESSSESSRRIEPQTLEFRASMLYHWGGDFTVSQAITTFLCETRPENCKGQQCRKRYARKRNKNDGEFFARQ